MSNSVDTLYYDGQCPMCSAEMVRLRQCADAGLQLVDIYQVQEDGDLPPRDELLRSLHLRNAEGQLLSGLDANVAAWQHTRFGWLWRWMCWPLVKPLADAAYNGWARVRYAQLYERRERP
jgi:predicted DCC family thiol-disulfide oxidoreductase YuxK